MSDQKPDIYSNKQFREALERNWQERNQEQRERAYDWDLIVATCYEVIRDCPDPFIRCDAAMLLQKICSRDDLNVVKGRISDHG
ncbi:hypothetical protein ACLUS7_20885 [Enterobacterales bacterium BD_CKDN230030183-1A_HGKHYDSX7]